MRQETLVDFASVRDLALLLWANDPVKAILGLLAANVLASLAAALHTRVFSPAAVADWLATRALPYLLGAGVMQIVPLTVPAAWTTLGTAAANAVWLFVVASLIGHTLDALRQAGLPIPGGASEAVLAQLGQARQEIRALEGRLEAVEEAVERRLPRPGRAGRRVS